MTTTTATEPTPTPAPTPAPAPAAGDPPAPTPASVAAPAPNGHDLDWRASIADPKVKEFAGRFTSVADLAKSTLDLRQKLSTAITPPGKDARPEDIAEYHKKLGVPDAPDKYELVPAEGQSLDKGFKTKMADAFHAAKVSADGAKILNQAWNGIVAEQAAAQASALDTAREEATVALRKEWPGKEFDANVAHAKKAAKAFGGEDFLAWVEKATIEGITVGDHPRFLKTFAQVGRRMGEDGVHAGMTAEETVSAQGEIPKLRGELREAQTKGNSSLAASLQTKLNAAYEKAFPGSRKF